MAESSRQRGRYAVGVARRAQILDTAVRHFSTVGYNRASLAGVAREVGISEAGLLHHFASKADLLLEVLAHSEGLDRQAMAAHDLPRAGLGYFDLFQWCVDRNVERPGIVALFVLLSAEAAAADHPANAWFAERYRRLTAEIAASLRAGIDGDEIRPEVDCVAVARELIALSDGLQIQWLLTDQGFDLPATYRASVDRIRARITLAGQDADSTSTTNRSGPVGAPPVDSSP
ncbi:MAG: TetR/AcrR family transcriptional regulator [Dactylosporangium sp.]|nr:TetR/AcrR family transcriptional regulator [Dactylosporangium sp.]NNJ61262.1 TetR/AcrR family transcriptional regulator [Dactylosporangium sp.]